MANVLPDISSTTPKVCLFEYEGDGQKLIDACVNQTKTYSAIAGKKAGFMAANQQKANAVTKYGGSQWLQRYDTNNSHSHGWPWQAFVAWRLL